MNLSHIAYERRRKRRQEMLKNTVEMGSENDYRSSLVEPEFVHKSMDRGRRTKGLISGGGVERGECELLLWRRHR